MRAAPGDRRPRRRWGSAGRQSGVTAAAPATPSTFTSVLIPLGCVASGTVSSNRSLLAAKLSWPLNSTVFVPAAVTVTWYVPAGMSVESTPESGPLALNASRHWARGKLEDRAARLSLGFYPALDFERVDILWIRAAADRPAATLRSTLVAQVPDAVAQAILDVLHLPPDQPLATLTRDDRRRLVHAVTEWPLPVTDTRGYTFAEVTAGGVPLTEIDPATMESRACPGLYLVGEILDVDGRIGGFNFQWAWSTAALAGRAVNSATPQLRNSQ